MNVWYLLLGTLATTMGAVGLLESTDDRAWPFLFMILNTTLIYKAMSNAAR